MKKIVLLCATILISGGDRAKANEPSVTPQQFGAKCNGVADDSAGMQAAEDAAKKNGVPVFYSGKCSFSKTINLGIGVIHRGSGVTNAILNYSGTGWAFSLQTPVTFPCILGAAPSFRDFALNTPHGSGIQLNNPSVAGFYDICTASAKGQSVLSNGRMENLILSSATRGMIGVQFSKVFNYAIRDVNITFYGTQFDLEGSDNIDFQHNNMNDALEQELLANGHGTFGGSLHVHNNTFNSIYTNASYFINSSYLQIIIEDNVFETQLTGGKAAINISGGLSVTIADNGMYVSPRLMPYWLQVSGAPLETLALRNNYTGGLMPTANFNGGAGTSYMYNGALPQFIFGSGNPSRNVGIPFFTRDEDAGLNNFSPPPAAPGVVEASVTPASPNGAYGPYATSMDVQSGCFVLPATDGPGGQVNFPVRPLVSDVVDVWVNGFAPPGKNQKAQISVNGGATYAALGLSGQQAWYKAFSGISVHDPVLALKNDDLANRNAANICSVAFVKH